MVQGVWNLKKKKRKKGAQPGIEPGTSSILGNFETRDFSRKMNYPTKPLSRIADKLTILLSSRIAPFY